MKKERKGCKKRGKKVKSIRGAAEKKHQKI
jgi:hypothetical protein